MLGLSVDGEHLPKVADFYLHKSVFVTGTSGLLGSVLLETLLRCCPGIESLYILLRSKKNVQPEVRKEQILNKKIFERLKEENPELLDKVRVIAGDASLPNLGMSEEDVQLLTEEVSIVFHCAAVTDFNKSLNFALINNVLSLNTVIELCRRMRKFEVLVYTSTAYSNSNHTNMILKEEVYRLPFRAETFLDALKNEDDGKLQELFAHCKPDWPNTYVFSKCLAENVIMDTASDLPIAVIRPSIIFGTWKYPIPGYEEGKSLIAASFIAIGKGFLRTVYADPNNKFNFVPADIVANAHILAALSVGTKRCASPMIVHCTATEKFEITISESSKIATQVVLKFPMPQSFSEPTYCILVPYKYLYYIIAAYYHYLPAIVLDGFLKIIGKKPRIYSSYRFLDKVTDSGSFFFFHLFEFERNNFEYLDKLIHPDDKKDLALYFRDANFLELSLKVPEVAPFYDWKTDQKSPSERQKIKYRFHMIIKCIQGMFIIIFNLLLYWIFSLIFL